MAWGLLCTGPEDQLAVGDPWQCGEQLCSKCQNLRLFSGFSAQIPAVVVGSLRLYCKAGPRQAQGLGWHLSTQPSPLSSPGAVQPEPTWGPMEIRKALCRVLGWWGHVEWSVLGTSLRSPALVLGQLLGEGSGGRAPHMLPGLHHMAGLTLRGC